MRGASVLADPCRARRGASDRGAPARNRDGARARLSLRRDRSRKALRPDRAGAAANAQAPAGSADDRRRQVSSRGLPLAFARFAPAAQSTGTRGPGNLSMLAGEARRTDRARRSTKLRGYALDRHAEPLSAERRFLLISHFALQRAKSRIDFRRIVKVPVLRLGCDLELVDRAFEIALPRVVLALMAMREHLLVLSGIRARGEELQRTIARKAR